MKFLVIWTLFVLGMSSCGPSKPVTDRAWRFVGDKWVNYGLDHDVLKLSDAKDEFAKLKLRVTDAPLRIYDMKVYFDNGEVQDVPIKSLIRQGGESRVIDLTGSKRRLDRIEFWYETKGHSKGHSRIALWGY